MENENTHGNDRDGFRLRIGGSMTTGFLRELEDRIIAAMRRYSRLEIDLSEVCEIDLSGLRLIKWLQRVGGTAVKLVALSPIVEHAISSLKSPDSGCAVPA